MLDDLGVGQIDWVFLALAVFVLVLVVSWRPYQRLERAYNDAMSMGQWKRARQAAFALHQSRNPIAILERLLMAGQSQVRIAITFMNSRQYAQALSWVNAGLGRARRAPQRLNLHVVGAFINSSMGQLDEMENNIEQAIQIGPTKGPEINPAICAIEARSRGGCQEDAIVGLRKRMLDYDSLDLCESFIAADTLQATGWFVIVCQIADSAISRHQELFRQPRAENMAGDKDGLEALRASTKLGWMSGVLGSALDACVNTDDWGRFDGYLRRLHQLESDNLEVIRSKYGWTAIKHAHDRDLDSMERSLAAMFASMEPDAENADVPPDPAFFAARARLIVQDFDGVLAVLEKADDARLTPLNQSEKYSFLSLAHEGLGDSDRADEARRRSVELARAAYWNKTADLSVAGAELEDFHRCVEVPHDDTPFRQATSASGAAPVDTSPLASVTSPHVTWLWVLAVGAFMPIVGIPFAITVVVLGLILVLKKKALPLDRRFGTAGLSMGVLALAFHAVITVHFALSLAQDRMFLAEPSEEPAEFLSDSGEFVEAVHWPDRVDTDRALRTVESGVDGEDAAISGGLTWWNVALIFAVLVVSIVFHELGHAVAALLCGDPTSCDMERITWNPIRHLSLVGSVLVPLALYLLPGDAIIGWARPVRVNPARYRRLRTATLAVSLAGISLNLILAFLSACVFTLALVFLYWRYPECSAEGLFVPFTGVTIFGPAGMGGWEFLLSVSQTSIWLNIFLAGFNLIPVPPLDGFGVLRAVVPECVRGWLERMSGVGFLVILLLIAFNGLTLVLLPIALIAAAVVGASLFIGGWTVF